VNWHGQNSKDRKIKVPIPIKFGEIIPLEQGVELKEKLKRNKHQVFRLPLMQESVSKNK
jgi:hypothetical protein